MSDKKDEKPIDFGKFIWSPDDVVILEEKD